MNNGLERDSCRGRRGGLPRRARRRARWTRLARRAAREGLIDVAYAQVDSPLGPLTVAATRRGPRDARLSRAPARRRARRGSPTRSRRGCSRRRRGSTRCAASSTSTSRASGSSSTTRSTGRSRRGFFRRCCEATARIGYGEVVTYAEVAEKAGNAKAVRAAGNGLGSNPLPVVVPCHRVLRTGGELGGYTGGLERKEFLLDLERR